jgi:hypothetical protein
VLRYYPVLKSGNHFFETLAALAERLRSSSGVGVYSPETRRTKLAAGQEVSMLDRSALLGTWKMVSWQRESVATGESADALGPDPVGLSVVR